MRCQKSVNIRIFNFHLISAVPLSPPPSSKSLIRFGLQQVELCDRNCSPFCNLIINDIFTWISFWFNFSQSLHIAWAALFLSSECTWYSVWDCNHQKLKTIPTNACYLPPEVWLILSLIVGQSYQVISKVLGSLKVQHIDVWSRGSNPAVVSSSHHYWDDVESKGFEELLCHIIRAEGIFKGEIEPWMN